MNYSEMNTNDVISIYKSANKRKKIKILNSGIDINILIDALKPNEIEEMLTYSSSIAKVVLNVMEKRIQNYQNPIGKYFDMSETEIETMDNIRQNFLEYTEPKLSLGQKIIKYGRDSINRLRGIKMLEAPNVDKETFYNATNSLIEYQRNVKKVKGKDIVSFENEKIDLNSSEKNEKANFRIVRSLYASSRKFKRTELIEKYKQLVEPEKSDLVEVAVMADELNSSRMPVGDIRKVSEFKIGDNISVDGDVYLVDNLEDKNKEIYQRNLETGKMEKVGRLHQHSDGSIQVAYKGKNIHSVESSSLSYTEESILKEKDFTEKISLQFIEEKSNSGRVEEIKRLNNDLFVAKLVNDRGGVSYSLVSQDGRISKCKSESLKDIKVADENAMYDADKANVQNAKVKSSFSYSYYEDGNMLNQEFCVYEDQNGETKIAKSVGNKSFYPVQLESVYVNKQEKMKNNKRKDDIQLQKGLETKVDLREDIESGEER